VHGTWQAIEAEEELRVMTGRAREAERRAREAEELVRKHRERAREAEEDVRVLRERIRDTNGEMASRGESRRESLGGHSRRSSGISVSEAVMGEGERDKEKLARALEKVQVRVQLLLACRPPLMPGASRRT
jgi:hypothetical protein